MTLSIAVVTKRAGITLTLRSKVHDLVEVRPTGAWLSRPWNEDVVVLDLETAAKTLSAIEELRSSGERRPIVVVGGEDKEWMDLSELFSDLLVVPLPVTAVTLLDTVDRAASLATISISASQAPSESSAGGPATVGPGVSVVAPPRIERQPASATSRQVEPTKHKAPSRGNQAIATPEGPGVPTVQEPASTRVVHYVELLLRDVALLPRLSQTAEVVRRVAVAAVPADASVVLVPDSNDWRVEAGDNLRPLEERFQLDPTHWLVSEVALQRRGLVIKNTDIARNRLAGAPLASWANWLALPVGDTDVIVVLAREDEAFSKAEMTRAAEAIAHLASEVRHAAAVRALARALSDFRDLVD